MFLFLLFVNLFKTKLIIGSGKKIFFRFFLQASKTRLCVCAACPFSPHLFVPQIYQSHFDVIYRVILHLFSVRQLICCIAGMIPPAVKQNMLLCLRRPLWQDQIFLTIAVQVGRGKQKKPPVGALMWSNFQNQIYCILSDNKNRIIWLESRVCLSYGFFIIPLVNIIIRFQPHSILATPRGIILVLHIIPEFIHCD